jgi:hypothetical protein
MAKMEKRLENLLAKLIKKYQIFDKKLEKRVDIRFS